MIDFEHMDEILDARQKLETELAANVSEGLTISENQQALLAYTDIDKETFSLYFVSIAYSDLPNEGNQAYIDEFYECYTIGRGRL